MRAKFIKTSTTKLLSIESSEWQEAEQKTLDMIGAPVALQPTPMIRNSWKDKEIGAVKKVTVSALHNGEALAFRLTWADPNKDVEILDNDQFVDAAAIFLPTSPQTPLFTMGAPNLEANMWYWRGDQKTGRHVVAQGIGTTRTIDEELIKVSSEWLNGQWNVIIARALRIATDEPVIQLQAGGTLQFALAVWEGSQGERAGIKSLTPMYTELALDAISQ